MSKFKNNQRVMSFRKFDRLDGDIYTTYDLAWSVEAIECYANKVAEGMLDVLAETVLELLNVKEMTPGRIAKLLDVSDEIVNKIIKDLARSEYPLYDEKEKCVTKKGIDYIEKKDAGEFLEEKVFGYMFVSRIDGEVFPYFMEGKLPWPLRQNEILYLSFDEESQSTLLSDRAQLLDRVNRSFHRYGRITKASKELERTGLDATTIDFIKEELHDRSFHEEETLADVEEEKNLRNARIKLLNTQPTELYIRCRLCVSKANPEKFIIDSPFPKNNTSWYSECFHRMIMNNELIYAADDDEIGLEYFCEGITNQFYVDFPEMQSKDFEHYIKAQFPKMLSCSISSECMDKYREVFNLRNLCDEHQVKRNVIVTEGTKALELILNNYVAKTRKDEIIRKYRDNIQTETEIEDMLDHFGITDCTALRKEKRNLDYGRVNMNRSIMSNFRGYRMGSTVIEKYYYLIAEATFNERSRFRRLLIKEGTDIIDYIDFINQMRNSYGGHNDGTRVVEVSVADYQQFYDYFVRSTKILLDYID